MSIAFILMEIPLLLFLLPLFVLNPREAFASVDTSEWTNIDCGALEWGLDDNLISWETDEDYIQTGRNMLVSKNMIPMQMNTLRFFPEGNTNCYSLPDPEGNRVLLRAGFYYGNYDSISKPPTFDLQLDGNRWTTVTTSMDEEPIYHEIIYKPQRGRISMCLVRGNDGGTPFISSIELVPLPADLYREMGGTPGFYLRSRADFGGTDDIRYNFLDDEEKYNRIWKAEGAPNYPNISSFSPESSTTENDPPFDVLNSAITAAGPSDSLNLLVNLPQGDQSAYIILYLMELDGNSSSNNSRKYAIYVDGRDMNHTVRLDNDACQVVLFYPVAVTGPVNVTLSPVEDSRFPPMINAMEVFTTVNIGQSTGYSKPPPSSLPFITYLLILALVIL